LLWLKHGVRKIGTTERPIEARRSLSVPYLKATPSFGLRLEVGRGSKVAGALSFLGLAARAESLHGVTSKFGLHAEYGIGRNEKGVDV
jgi:hypothetical protein